MKTSKTLILSNQILNFLRLDILTDLNIRIQYRRKPSSDSSPQKVTKIHNWYALPLEMPISRKIQPIIFNKDLLDMASLRVDEKGRHLSVMFRVSTKLLPGILHNNPRMLWLQNNKKMKLTNYFYWTPAFAPVWLEFGQQQEWTDWDKINKNTRLGFWRKTDQQKYYEAKKIDTNAKFLIF